MSKDEKSQESTDECECEEKCQGCDRQKKHPADISLTEVVIALVATSLILISIFFARFFW